MAGYSGTPLLQKLGIKPDTVVATVDAPPGYRRMLGRGAGSLKFTDRPGKAAGFIHVFVRQRTKLEKYLKQLRKTVADAGTVWVSWPKKSSGVQSDVTEDVIRDVALPLGFVDVKVCAVDETWSGLKLVVRREHRAKRAEHEDALPGSH
jgi:hypothetical protein